ncbi:hypothetical protein PoB_003007600 [Plakobranchus ocellatus]|uniref:Uncharacterized protein n=1 Tax=Plakobranchus ocellatus TaxID=259542 RepID=A0AAV4AAA3_9GAST|nr:hypothetical protein PoB_003007600 [Plakobranchus ocellatus]
MYRKCSLNQTCQATAYRFFYPDFRISSVAIDQDGTKRPIMLMVVDPSSGCRTQSRALDFETAAPDGKSLWIAGPTLLMLLLTSTTCVYQKRNSWKESVRGTANVYDIHTVSITGICPQTKIEQYLLR